MDPFVPGDVRYPGVYQQYELVREAGLAALPRTVLLVGWRLSTLPDTYDYQPRRVRTRADVQDLAGSGSQLDLMARAAFGCGAWARLDAERGSLPEIWVMVIPPVAVDVGTAAATQTATFTGPATAPGRVRVSAGSESVIVAIPDEATPTDVAAAVVAALAPREPELTHTAAAAAGVVTWTAREPGLWGEDLVIDIDVSEAPGIGVTIARGTNGAGTVSLTDALDAALAADWTFVVLPQDDAATLAALPDHVRDAWDYEQKRYAVYCLGARQDLSAAETVAASIDDLRVQVCNAEQVAGAGVPFDVPSSSRSFSFEVAAAVATRQVTHGRINWNYNRATLPVFGRPKNVVRQVVNDAINAGVTVVLEPEKGTAPGSIVTAVNSSVTDQTGQTSAPDTRWQPISIPLVIADVHRQIDIVLDRFAQITVEDDTLLTAKAAALEVLLAEERAGHITRVENGQRVGITDESVEASFEVVDGTSRLRVDLRYDVVTPNDIVAVKHFVGRATA